jgi:hypothetical protein
MKNNLPMLQNVHLQLRVTWKASLPKIQREQHQGIILGEFLQTSFSGKQITKCHLLRNKRSLDLSKNGSVEIQFFDNIVGDADHQCTIVY